MPLSLIKKAKKKVVGTKQTLKSIEKGKVEKVYVAKDAEAHVVKDLLEKCQAIGIEVAYVDTMAELGKACGIDVGAASAAIIES